MPIHNLLKSAKVTPSNASKEEKLTDLVDTENFSQRFVRLHNLLQLYGKHKHPKLGCYDELQNRGDLVKWRYIPPKSTTIYISHEWTGTDSPDPDGNQMYHLLLLLERLQKGEISRTDMDAFHSILYKQNHTTTAREWKRILNSDKTYIWYDGFCVPRSRREDGFRSIPSYIRRCDFMIILVPGCTHFDRIDPRTQRKMNLCYRTYRLRARCVFELFCSFLTTRGGEKARPSLLVRSGTGTPNWISPLECQKLAVGTSTFECCETNHTQIKTCRRPLIEKILRGMIQGRVNSLFQREDTLSEARWTSCFETWWLRGLSEISTKTDKIVTASDFNRCILRRSDTSPWFDREGFPVLAYASLYNNSKVVKDLLQELDSIPDKRERSRCLVSRIPKQGLSHLGITGGITALVFAMGFADKTIVSLLLEHGADPYVMFKGESQEYIFFFFYLFFSLNDTSAQTLGTRVILLDMMRS